MNNMTTDTGATAPRDRAPPTSAREAFAGEGLPWPPVPERLASALQAAGNMADGVFASRALTIGPYALEAYVGEVLRELPDDYALVGFDGHGMNSWAVHFFLVQGPLGLFVQLPWGGAFTDAEADRAEVARVFAWAERLLTRVTALQTAGRWPAGRRLVVAATWLRQPRWAWVSTGPTTNPVAWRNGQDLEATLDKALDAL
jgi:hypothetical protein